MVARNLSKVRENHIFDMHYLNDWLSKYHKSFGKVIDVKQFIGGQSNPTFFLSSEKDTNIILRKKPPGKLLPSAHAVEREYKVQKALMKTEVPCPKMIFLCEDEKIIGTPFYIMEFIKGIVYESILDVKDKKKRKSIFLQMVRMLGRLHNINYKKVGLKDFGKSGNYAERQISRWEKQWHLCKQRDLPEINIIINWLNKHIPNKFGSSIVHGDYRLGNLIYNENETTLKAVLDWELATIGDPLADFGYMLYPYYIPVGERHGLMGCNFKKENLPTVNEIIETYCYERKIKYFDPLFYVVLSMFRSVAILEGVYARYVNGNESSPNAKEIGNDVIPLAKATHSLIK